MNTDGDDHLCSFELRLWSLVQHVLLKYSTFIIFKYDSWIVPKEMGGPKRALLQFFVPVVAPQCREIVEFLEYELEKEKQEDRTIMGTVHPGTDVQISMSTFSGIQPYLERDDLEQLTKETYGQLMDMLKKEKGN